MYFIQLVALCPEITTEFGLDQILAPLIADIKLLETVGINIQKNGVHNFTGSLSMVIADNLAAHTIGGYQESFNTLRTCRFCLVTRLELKDHFRDTMLVPRTRES